MKICCLQGFVALKDIWRFYSLEKFEILIHPETNDHGNVNEKTKTSGNYHKLTYMYVYVGFVSVGIHYQLRKHCNSYLQTVQQLFMIGAIWTKSWSPCGNASRFEGITVMTYYLPDHFAQALLLPNLYYIFSCFLKLIEDYPNRVNHFVHVHSRTKCSSSSVVL